MEVNILLPFTLQIQIGINLYLCLWFSKCCYFLGFSPYQKSWRLLSWLGSFLCLNKLQGKDVMTLDPAHK